MDIPVSTFAGGQIKFQIAGAARSIGHCRNGVLGQGRAPQIGVQHGSCQIEDPFERRGGGLRQPDGGALRDRAFADINGFAVGHCSAGFVEQAPQNNHSRFMSGCFHECRGFGGFQNPIKRRDR